MLTIPRGCGVNLKPVCSFLERSVAKDELEVGTSPGQVPLLTAAWDHRADQGAGPVGPPGAPLPAHGGVMSGIHDSSAGSQPALLSWAPGLPQSPHSCGWWTCPLGISHAILGPAGHPLERGYLPATRSCAAGDTSSSDGLSPRPVAPSPVPPSLALSLHSGLFLYPQALAASGMGAGTLVVPDPRGRVSSPRLVTHEAPAVSTCVREDTQ